LSGFVSADDGFRQSGGDPHGFPRPNGEEVESNQFVPYGTNLNDTIGAPNFPLNLSQLPWDYNRNGTIDAADYVIWRKTLGQSDPDPGNNPLAANSDRDGTVDQTDYLAWAYHLGETVATITGGSAQHALGLPEPSGLLFSTTITVAPLLRKRRRLC
jgi:hypothetical protein